MQNVWGDNRQNGWKNQENNSWKSQKKCTNRWDSTLTCKTWPAQRKNQLYYETVQWSLKQVQ